MAYANMTQLAAYLNKQVSELPTDYARLLERASELIDYITKNKAADVTEQEILNRLAKSVCAQVESWISGGENQDILGKDVVGYQLSKLSYTFSDNNKSIGNGILCQRAARELWLTGLLTNRVRPSR